LALRQIRYERPRISAVRLLITTGALSLEEEASIVDIVENEHPLSLATVQPVVHELEYVCLEIPPSRDLDCICNVSEALLKSGRVARRNIRSGWAKTGLYPFDPDKVLKDIKKPEVAVQIPQQSEATLESPLLSGSLQTPVTSEALKSLRTLVERDVRVSDE